jgi:hypothetical protein
MLLPFNVNIRSLSDFAKMLGFVTPREVHPACAGVYLKPQHQAQARVKERLAEEPPFNILH